MSDTVYLQSLDSFPQGGRSQVSSGGGEYPRWRGDGRELYYLGRDGVMRSVAVRPSPRGIELDAPQRLFPLPAAYVGSYSYDVSRDGKRFLALAPFRRMPREPLTVIVNWPALLKK